MYEGSYHEHLADDTLVNQNTSNKSFTGMSINNGEQWKTQRNFYKNSSGTAYLNFRLTREKTSLNIGALPGSSSPVNPGFHFEEFSDSLSKSTLETTV